MFYFFFGGGGEYEDIVMDPNDGKVDQIIQWFYESDEEPVDSEHESETFPLVKKWIWEG